VKKVTSGRTGNTCLCPGLTASAVKFKNVLTRCGQKTVNPVLQNLKPLETVETDFAFKGF